MELKLESDEMFWEAVEVLIVLYGIETTKQVSVPLPNERLNRTLWN